MAYFVAFIIVAIAFILLASKSSYVLDYAVYVYVFNRGIRRYIDWVDGEFNPFSVITLTPLLITVMMLLPVLVSLNSNKRIDRNEKRVIWFLLGAFTVSFIIGFIRFRLAAIFALLEVLAPLAVLSYALWIAPGPRVQDRWIRCFSWCAIFVTLYGWFQYLTIPPWDAMWLVQSKMVGYMGIPEPTKMTCFSTMSERGVLAGFLGLSLPAMILSSRWRTPLSWLGVAIVFSGILLTLSRGGIILAVTVCMAYVIVNRGASFGYVLVGATVLTVVMVFGISAIPNNERISARYESLMTMKMSEDSSYKGRMQNMQWTLPAIAGQPLGFGLGAAGQGTRINTGTAETETPMIGDSGWLDVILTFGWLGFILLFGGLIKIWKLLSNSRATGSKDSRIMLARAYMFALIPVMFAGNFLTNFSIIWVVMGIALLQARAPNAAVSSNSMIIELSDPSPEIA